MSTETNPCGLRGLAFVEWADVEPETLTILFGSFGFSRVGQAPGRRVELFRQNAIRFVLNTEPGSFADHFQKEHGPSIPSLGLWVDDAARALEVAVSRGARPFEAPGGSDHALPAIHGVGGSLLYFVESEAFFDRAFAPHPEALLVPDKGFLLVDHLTNNVEKGGLATWSRFYKEIFGFTEVRTFDIRGQKTGLVSYALRSPDGSFCIPINEGTETASQIEEYLREYRGAGVQHIAFLTRDLLTSLDRMEGTGVRFLDIDPSYYETVYERVPGVTEDREHIQQHQVLVDGDPEGYLLQIFTQNLVGPIFIELIQRKNHLSFGEGNFGALFRSIERDQERRGTI
jgi:4-hydroxyphenylpyruvate dioxygenase